VVRLARREKDHNTIGENGKEILKKRYEKISVVKESIWNQRAKRQG
jgi:hypothetical protein